MKSERLLLLTLAAIQFSHIMDFMIMMPLGPQLMRIFEISPQQFSFLVSGYTFSAGVFGFLSAFVADRFARKPLLMFLFTGFVLGTLACSLAPGYGVLLAARILTGAFGGILSAMVFAVVGDVVPIERRGTAMGWVTAAFSAASVFGVPFGLFLASRINWHAPFFFLACLGIPVWFMAWRFIPNTPQVDQTRENPLQLVQRVSQDRNQQWALLLIILMMLGQFSVIPFLSPSMVANVGFSESSLAYIYLIGGFTTLFTGPWIGRLADRYGRQRVLYTFLLLSILPIIVITNLGPSPMMMVLALTTCFFVVSGGRMIPVMAMMTAAVAPRYRGSFMSLQSAVQQISAGVASLLAGWIIVENGQGQLLNYPIVGYLAAATSLVSLFVASRIQVVASEPRPVTLEPELQPAQA